MKHWFIIFWLFTLVWPQKGYNDSFQLLGTTTRMANLGQAVIADYGQPGAWIVNPAATAGLSRMQIYGTYMHQFGMAEYGSTGLLVPQNPRWTWGVFVLGVYVDNLFLRPDLRTVKDLETRRDSIRALVAHGFRSFHDWEMSGSFNIARRYHWDLDLGWMLDNIPVDIPVGINLHFMRKNLYHYTGMGIGADVGGMFIFDLEDILPLDGPGRIAVGVALKHVVGTRILWNTRRLDIIPQQFITGFKYTQPIWTPFLTLHFYRQTNWQYGEQDYGLEIDAGKLISIYAGFRIGYYQGGLEIRLSEFGIPVSVGYGFSNHAFGMIHRFGFQWHR
ncbi:MAG: hypothetical protein ACE5D8_05995 [Fidelibacterota bacterium]